MLPVLFFFSCSFYFFFLYFYFYKNVILYWLDINESPYRKSSSAAPPGRIVGCDFAGTVVDANGSSWKQGQRVAGFVQGTSRNGVGEKPLRGVFAEYCLVDSTLVFPIPDTTTDQEAAVLGVAFATAVQVLFQRLGLPEPSSSSSSSGISLLVNGGASSVGMYAIQLAKLAGLFVVATGSKKNHDLLLSLGADTVVDYRDADWPEQVRKITNDGLEHAFDCISENGTYQATAKALSSTKGGHVVGLLPVRKGDEAVVEELSKKGTKVRLESTIVYTVFERPLNYPGFENCGPATPKDKAIWEKYLVLLPELLSSGKIKPNRIREMGGLDDILAGFEEMKAGKVSAEKFVYKI